MNPYELLQQHVYYNEYKYVDFEFLSATCSFDLCKPIKQGLIFWRGWQWGNRPLLSFYCYFNFNTLQFVVTYLCLKVLTHIHYFIVD